MQEDGVDTLAQAAFTIPEELSADLQPQNADNSLTEKEQDPAEKIYTRLHADGQEHSGDAETIGRVCPEMARLALKDRVIVLEKSSVAERMAAKARAKRESAEVAKAAKSAAPVLTPKIVENRTEIHVIKEGVDTARVLDPALHAASSVILNAETTVTAAVKLESRPDPLIETHARIDSYVVDSPSAAAGIAEPQPKETETIETFTRTTAAKIHYTEAVVVAPATPIIEKRPVITQDELSPEPAITIPAAETKTIQDIEQVVLSEPEPELVEKPVVRLAEELRIHEMNQEITASVAEIANDAPTETLQTTENNLLVALFETGPEPVAYDTVDELQEQAPSLSVGETLVELVAFIKAEQMPDAADTADQQPVMEVVQKQEFIGEVGQLAEVIMGIADVLALEIIKEDEESTLQSALKEKLCEFLTLLGYPEPEQTLQELLLQNKLDFLIDAMRYLAQLTNHDNDQEFLTASAKSYVSVVETPDSWLGRFVLQLLNTKQYALTA